MAGKNDFQKAPKQTSKQTVLTHVFKLNYSLRLCLFTWYDSLKIICSPFLLFPERQEHSLHRHIAKRGLHFFLTNSLSLQSLKRKQGNFKRNKGYLLILSPAVMAAVPSVCASLCQSFCEQHGCSCRNFVSSSALSMAQLRVGHGCPLLCLPHNLSVSSVSGKESTPSM